MRQLSVSPVNIMLAAAREGNYSGRGRFSSPDCCHLPTDGPSVVDQIRSFGFCFTVFNRWFSFCCWISFSGNGSSPTEDCCNSLKLSMSGSIDCACLIVTGNVPVSIPFIRTLALSLPQACNAGVPVQCSASGVPLPSPGPALFVPAPAPPPPHHHHAPAHPPRHQRAAAFPPALSPRGPRVAKTWAAPTAVVDPPSVVEDDEPPPTVDKPTTTSPLKPSLLPKTLQNPNTNTSTSYISSFSSPLILMLIGLVILLIR